MSLGMSDRYREWVIWEGNLEGGTVVLPKPKFTCDEPCLGHIVHLTEASAAQTRLCQANMDEEI